MITLNLISSKRKVSRKRSNFTIVLYSLFGLFTAYFVFQVLYVSINLYTSGNKLNGVRTESKAISTEILKDNAKLNRFILSKFILTEINKLRKSQFSYKQYLDEIVAMTPQGNDLTSVSFETKGYVNVTIKSSDDNSFHSFENNVRTKDLTSTDFTSIFSNSVFRDEGANYTTELIVKIKTK
ncbi:MAG TPA: hypothetical protein VF837_03455 [Patescibacteria group bacterium]